MIASSPHKSEGGLPVTRRLGEGQDGPALGPLQTATERRYRQWRLTPHGQEVYRECVRVVTQLREKGFTFYSIRGIIYVVRFHRHVEHGPNDYKINNNVTPHLARELMRNGDAPPGFFRLRELHDKQLSF